MKQIHAALLRFVVFLLFFYLHHYKAQSFVNPSVESWSTANTCDINTPPNNWSDYSTGGIGFDEANFPICPTTIPPAAANGSVYARALASTATTGEGIFQNVSGFTPSTAYAVSFKYAGSNLYGGSGPFQWHIFIDDIDVNQTPVCQSSTSTWTPHSYTFVATTATHKLGFRPYTTSNSNASAAIDDFSISISCTVPAQPVSVSGPTNPCIGSSGLTYSIPAVSGAAGYSWTIPGSWTGSSTTNTISLTVGGSGTIGISVSNTCGESAMQILSVTANAPPVISNISGPTNFCTTLNTINYSVSPVSGVTSYSWTLPGGWTGGGSSNLISTTPGTTGIITVSASNVCGTSALQTLTVTVGQPPVLNAIGGLTTNCVGTSSVYSVTAIPGASYIWSLPSGWTGSSSTNTIFPVTGPGGVITVVASNSCGTTASSLNVITTSPPVPGNIFGPSPVCVGSAVIYSVAPINGVSAYSWTVPLTWTATASNNNTISVIPSSPGIISLTALNICGSGFPPTTLIVSVSPLPVILATASKTIFCKSNLNSLTLTANGALNYTWTPGSVGQTISVNPNVTTMYTVTGKDANGCINSNTINLVVVICDGISEQDDPGGQLFVYPSPFHDLITITIQNQSEVFIYNSLGALVKKITLPVGTNSIDLSREASGIYFLQVKTIHGSETKRILKE